MDESRVMEIWNPADEQVGSGYLIADRLVLTAYHVVKGIAVGENVEVRQLDRNGRTAWIKAQLAWPPGPVDVDERPERDGALLRITEPAWQPPTAAPVRFGRIVGSERVPCIGLGFPHAVRRGTVSDTMAVRGHVDPLHAMKSKMLTVHVDTGIVPRPQVRGSGWNGGSGAALLCGPLLLAVLATDKGIADEVLDAVPVTTLAVLPGFADTLREHGVSLRFQDIDPSLPDEEPDSPYVPTTVRTAPLLSSRVRPVPALIVIGTAAVLAVAVLVRTRLQASQLVWPVGGVSTGCMALWGIGQFRRPRAPEQAREVARQTLAESVRRQALERRRQLLGADRKAINTTFVTLPVVGRGPESAQPHGDFDGIARYLDALEPKRLVITGGPGAGKTLLANQLVVRLLARRRYVGPVPVLVGIADWDTDTPFTEWLTVKVAQEYLNGDETTARDLVASGRIMPVLDGLDEMDGLGSVQFRALAALAWLNRYEGPLVLTCRTGDYATLYDGDNRLLDCATVQIEKVEGADGWHYLAERALDRARLTGLETELTRPNSAMGALLTSPWTLTLASLASRSSAGATELLSFVGVPAADGGADRLRERLLRQLIPSLCEPLPGERPRYASKDVTGWLRLLVSHLHRGSEVATGGPGSRDLVVHALWPVGGPRARYLGSAVSLTLWAPAFALLWLCLRRHPELPFHGLPLLLLLTPAPALAAWNVRAGYIQPRRILFQRLRFALGWSRIGFGALLGGILVLPSALLFGPGYGLAFGTAFGLVFGCGFALSVRADIDRRYLVASGMPAASAVALAAGLLAGGLGDFIGVVAGCGAGAMGLAVGVPVGLRAASRNHGGDPDPNPPGVPTPLSPLRNDVVAGLISGLVVAVLTLYAALSVDWLRVPWPLAVATALACGLAAGPGFVADVSRQYLGVLLATRGRLPWRLAAFLRWCHRAGLLRSAGTVYQVRHEELLEWLQRTDISR